MADIAYDIAHALLNAEAVLLRPHNPFTFASGLRSPIYCDNRVLLGDVAARRIVTQGFVAQCGDAEILAGPATGGIPWAAWAAEILGLPMAYVRGTAKGHGRGRQVEGAAVSGRRIVLLEDTVSTGESALQAAAALRANGGTLSRCVCIFTWGWADTAASFAATNLELVPLTTLAALLDVAESEGRLREGDRSLIESWAANPREWTPPDAQS